MTKRDIIVETKDGSGKAGLFTSSNSARANRPGVILYMDAFGPRPALDGAGRAPCRRRLCRPGARSLLSLGELGPYNTHTAFGDQRIRDEIMGMMHATTRPAERDTGSFIDALDREGAKGPIGTVGYCMGGGRAITAAAGYPERIAAAASFHGGCWRAMRRTARIAASRRSLAGSMSAAPASTTVFHRSNRRAWPWRCARPRSTMSSRIMSEWHMAGPCRTIASSMRRAPSGIGSACSNSSARRCTSRA